MTLAIRGVRVWDGVAGRAGDLKSTSEPVNTDPGVGVSNSGVMSAAVY